MPTGRMSIEKVSRKKNLDMPSCRFGLLILAGVGSGSHGFFALVCGRIRFAEQQLDGEGKESKGCKSKNSGSHCAHAQNEGADGGGNALNDECTVGIDRFGCERNRDRACHVVEGVSKDSGNDRAEEAAEGGGRLGSGGVGGRGV